MKVEEIEKLRWMKQRIEEATDGRQRLSTGSGWPFMVRVQDDCQGALYLAMVKNKRTGNYHADIKGYVRTFSGYCDGAHLKQLEKEIGRLSALVTELEAADIQVTEETLLTFSEDLERQEAERREGRLSEASQNQW